MVKPSSFPCQKLVLFIPSVFFFRLLLQNVAFYVHRNRTGIRTSTSSLTQLLSSDHPSSDDELMLNVFRCQLTY